MPGERNNARNNARCTQAKKTTHCMDNINTWKGLHVKDHMKLLQYNQNNMLFIDVSALRRKPSSGLTSIGSSHRLVSRWLIENPTKLADS